MTRFVSFASFPAYRFFMNYVEIMQQDEANYPDSVHKTFIVNVPSLFSMIWASAKVSNPHHAILFYTECCVGCTIAW